MSELTAKAMCTILMVSSGASGARGLAEQVVDAAPADRDFMSALVTRTSLGLVCFLDGDLEAAENHLMKSISIGDVWPAMHAWALALLGSVRLAQGRPSEALQVTREADQMLDQYRCFPEEVLIRTAHAGALFACGERAPARAAFERARALVAQRAATIDSTEVREGYVARARELAQKAGLSDWARG
jgi:ATP/maltotriose-dependent transcriptional regulator MalT